MNLFYKLKPVFDDGTMFWFFCPAHSDKNRPNLSLTYDGKYRGKWKCWACGYSGRISEQTLYQIGNQYKSMFSKKIHKFYRNPFDVWAQARSLPLPKESSSILGLPGASWCILEKVLKKLRAAWDGKSILFPLRDADMHVVGVHRRPEKTHLKGSRLGLFLPVDITDTIRKDNTIVICEGVTDTIVAMLIDFINVIGKPSALTGHKIILDFLKKHLTAFRQNVMIMADNDSIGIEGAKKLQKLIGGRIIIPNFKDIKATFNELGYEETKQWIENTAASSGL